MDYEITSPWWEHHGLPGCKSIINLTLTSFVTSRSLFRSGILISGGNGKLARFDQLFWTKLVPVRIDYYRTDCLFRVRFGLSSLWSAIGSFLSLIGRWKRSNRMCPIVSDRRTDSAPVFRASWLSLHYLFLKLHRTDICQCQAVGGYNINSLSNSDITAFFG